MNPGREPNQEKTAARKEQHHKEQRLAEKRDLRMVQRFMLFNEAGVNRGDVEEMTANFFPKDRLYTYGYTDDFEQRPNHMSRTPLRSVIHTADKIYKKDGGIFFLIFALATSSNDSLELRNIFASLGAVGAILSDPREPLNKMVHEHLVNFLNGKPGISPETLSPEANTEREKLRNTAAMSGDDYTLGYAQGLARAALQSTFSNHTFLNMLQKHS
jgi:hypothetical protein